MNLRALCRCAAMLPIVCLLLACGSAEPGALEPTANPSSETHKSYHDIVVGFAQIGAESEWRTANTRSIQDTANQLGVELKLSDAQQMRDNQIKAIRSFIAQKVDVIGVSPVVEDGWDEIFSEAKQAGIPLILLDRYANVPDDLFSAYIGSDFKQEGQSACQEIARLLNNQGNVVVLDGTERAAPAVERRAGFEQCLQEYPKLRILDSAPGDFIRARGNEAMKALLQTHGTQIDALFAENDDMALGAIQAIEEYGLRPGVDIKVVSIDAVRGAFEAMIAGKLNATVECNPLLGPQFFAAALALANDQPVEKHAISSAHVYRQDTAAQELPNRKY